MKLFTLKKLLLIPAVIIGIGIFSGDTLADETGTFSWIGATPPVTYTTSPQTLIRSTDWQCADSIHSTSKVWLKIGGGAYVDTGAVCGGFADMTNVTIQTGTYTWKVCETPDQVTCGAETTLAVVLDEEEEEPAVILPTLSGGQVTSVLVNLTTATQGILDFIVSGGALWFVVAGALILLYFFRKVLSLKTATQINKAKIDQKKSMKHFANRQRSLQELRRRGY